MRILIATDAWRPQVNGVVRTLTSLARAAATLGAEIEFLTPDGFPSMHAADLSGPADRAAEPQRDRAADRGRLAGGDPYRDRRSDRLVDARLLPAPQASLHHLLHHALSRICLGADRHSACRGAMRCCGVFTSGRRDHGRHQLAARGVERAGASRSSAPGRAASTPICSIPTSRQSSIFRGRSLRSSAVSRSRRISRRSSRSTCPAPRS